MNLRQISSKVNEGLPKACFSPSLTFNFARAEGFFIALCFFYFKVYKKWKKYYNIVKIRSISGELTDDRGFPNKTIEK